MTNPNAPAWPVAGTPGRWRRGGSGGRGASSRRWPASRAGRSWPPPELRLDRSDRLGWVEGAAGSGFDVDNDVERKFRETRLYQVAPISTNLVLAHIAEHVLGLPRSF
mgnify:CR=1 FL=1